jgi:hypothetical protein
MIAQPHHASRSRKWGKPMLATRSPTFPSILPASRAKPQVGVPSSMNCEIMFWIYVNQYRKFPSSITFGGMGTSLPPPKLNPQRLTNPQSSGMTSRCGWRTPSVPIQIRASPCSIHGTANMCDILFLPFLQSDRSSVEGGCKAGNFCLHGTSYRNPRASIG